jgi:hypothetical protein
MLLVISLLPGSLDQEQKKIGCRLTSCTANLPSRQIAYLGVTPKPSFISSFMFVKWRMLEFCNDWKDTGETC